MRTAGSILLERSTPALRDRVSTQALSQHVIALPPVLSMIKEV